VTQHRDGRGAPSPAIVIATSALLTLSLGACTGTITRPGAGDDAGGTPGVAGASGSATGTGNAAGSGGRTGAGSGGGASSSGGSGTGSTTGSGGTPAQPPPATFGACPAGGGEPGPTPIMKLSTIQYRNTVRDLLASSGVGAVAGELTTMLSAVPEDSTVSLRGLDQRVSSDHLKAYFDVAVAAGNGATSTSSRLTALAGSCAATSPLAASCADSFLTSFGRRAFRRPLAADEMTSYRDIATGKSPAATTAAESIRNVVVAMMMSPRFVNHLELDGAPISGRQDYLQLSPYEVASRLSYTFWQTMPDDQLLAAAGDGSLATDAGFQTQLDRVFADPRTHETMWQFWNEWMRFDSFTGFASERPAFQALAAGENLGVSGHDHWGDMVTEVRDLTELYTWTQKGTFLDLMTSTVSVTKSADLAHLYGVPAWSGKGDYPRFTDGGRTGLLQRAALLASSLEQTNPFHRGALIRRAILCDNLPRPDPNSLPPGSLDPPPASNAMTTRQRFAAKVDGNNLCQGCHGSFSNLGYVMESYDALGRYRTSEKVFDEQTGKLVATLPIDTAAVPQVVGGDTRPVSGPAELNQRIIESGKVEGCLASTYFRYALRREPTAGSADACAYDGMRTDLDKPGVGLADVFRRLATEASFRRKKVGAP